MIELNFNDYYLINSSKEVLVFKKTEEEKLECQSINFITDESIDLYSATVNSNDEIFIVVLSKSGELHLYSFNNMNWSKNTIGKFDLVSNSYKQLEVIFVNEEVNIFYSYYNTSFSNIWMIQHIIFNKLIEERHNVVRYAAANIWGPFIIDTDSNGNIHLIYNNNSQVYYTLYNPFTKKWNSPVKQLSKQDLVNSWPYLFVDSKDNLHCLWLNKVKSHNQVNYMKMPIKGRDSFVWKTMIFPFKVFTEILPIIFQEKDLLKLIYFNEDSVKFLYSSDSGNSWLKGDKSILLEPEDTIFVLSTNLHDDSKANHLIKGISQILNIEEAEVIESNIELNEEHEEVVISDYIEDSLDKYEEIIQLLLQNQSELKEMLQSSIERETAFRQELILAVKDIEIKNGFFHKLFRSLNN